MIVFLLRPDVEGYQWLTLRREEEFNLLDFDSLPKRDGWQPLEVEWIDETPGQSTASRGDFPTLGTTPVFSQRAVDDLLDLLAPNGELLPLQCDTGRFFAYNVTRVVDALDEGRSDMRRFSSGRVMHVDTYSFRPEALRGEVLWKVPQLRGEVFVAEPFVRRVQEADLRGFEFRALWAE